MMRTNLSTRPFYNERAVHVWLGLLALVVIAATAFNVSRVLRVSGRNTGLAQQAAQDEARAADVRRRASQWRAGVDAAQIDTAALDAREANALIDRRTFSWTALFNQFETTLPDHVRITSVSPTIDPQGRVLLTIAIVAQSVDDVNEFMERLDGTGVFRELRPTQERASDETQIESVLEAVYQPAPVADSSPANRPAAPSRAGRR
jgi:Tfp pilus assembly protein PilN